MENENKKAEQYYKDNPDSLIPLFEKELKNLRSFVFEDIIGTKASDWIARK